MAAEVKPADQGDTKSGPETLRAADEERARLERALDPLRESIGELRLKEQEARIAEEGFAEQLAQAAYDAEALALAMEKPPRPNALQQEINRLQEALSALGAVNLAALDELGKTTERKAFLDAQSADLNEAVNTLEDAIRRIDRETRERLSDTFETVNKNLAEMFPQLFGGAAITETVFSWPGIGSLGIAAARTGDFPVVMGITLVVSAIVVLANLLTDLSYAWLNPRVQLK